jgi:fibro-slime domain-containing protein
LQTTSQDTTATEWASNTLDAYTLKPTFVAGGTATSVTAQFNNYWQTSFTTPPVSTLPYSIQVSLNTGLFAYTSSSFYPFGAGIGLFTYEASAVFTYSASTLQFSSAGDMWVYMGNYGSTPTLRVSLRGIHTSSSMSYDLSTSGLSGQVHMRIFYAHRSINIVPSIKITTLQRPAGYCNVCIHPSAHTVCRCDADSDSDVYV